MYKTIQNSTVIPQESLFRGKHQLQDSFESESKRLKLDLHSVPMSSQQQQQKQSATSFQTTGTPSTIYHDSMKGTFTPLTTTNSYEGLNHKMTAVSMISEKHFSTAVEQQPQLNEIQAKQQQITITTGSFDCPCGHLHGPGQGHHEDIGAVGFADFPLLRGPE